VKAKLILAILWAGLLIAPPLWPRAQSQRGQGVRIKVETGQEIDLYAESHALVIGINDYTHGWPDLPGVKRDVAEVSVVLREHGFIVMPVNNPTQTQLDQAIRSFITKYGQSRQNRLLIYFAGHGHTIEGVGGQQGYIVPADAPDPTRNEFAFKDAAINMDEIEAYVRRIEAKHLLWVFDSCFSGALFEATRSVPPAISTRTAQPVRQFITAGTADQRVPDNSIFRAQFVEGLRGEADSDGDEYVTGEELGLFLYNRVTNYSRSSQTPQHGKIRNPRLDKGDFVFALPKRTPPPPPSPNTELLDWNAVVNSDDPQDFENYIRKHCPGGIYCAAANATLRRLRARMNTTSNPPVKPSTPSVRMSATGVPLVALDAFTTVTVDATGKIANRRPNQECWGYVEDLGNGVKLEMVEIPAGEFEMGSNDGDKDEKPVHKVRVAGFLMGKYEVMQEQWAAVARLPKVKIHLDPDPSYFKGAKLPVEQVSWYEAQEFIARLNRKTGGRYALPSEAQWEYAARAGTKSAYAFGQTISNEVVNFAGDKTISVGRLECANAWGLFDMHGNVWEWCEDDWHNNYSGAPSDGGAWVNVSNRDSSRVFRGGSWSGGAVYCRSAIRHDVAPGARVSYLGFRLVRK
jgi:formylglycine-generating enzyme required for sulfatase activity